MNKIVTVKITGAQLKRGVGLLAQGKDLTNTRIDVHEILMAAIARGETAARRDGRMNLVAP